MKISPNFGPSRALPEMKQYYTCTPGASFVNTHDGLPANTIIVIPLDLTAPLRVIRAKAFIGHKLPAAPQQPLFALSFYRCPPPVIGDKQNPVSQSNAPELTLVQSSIPVQPGNVSAASQHIFKFQQEVLLDPAQAQYYLGFQCSSATEGISDASQGQEGHPAFVTSPAGSTILDQPQQLRIVADSAVCPFVILRSPLGVYHYGSVARDWT